MITSNQQRRFLLLFVLIISLFSGMPVWSETQVSISVSDNLATIGDRIRLKIIVKTTEEVDQINVKTAGKDYEILDQKQTEKRRQQDYTVFEKNIDVAFFKIGDFNVGPFEVELKKGEEIIETRETNSVPVTVKSVLEEGDKDIKPLKELAAIDGDPFYILQYVFLALAVLGVILGIVWYIRRTILKRKIAQETPLLSPLDEMIAGIGQLVAKDLFTKGKVKLYFLELTQILKRFLHRTYRFKAEDLTTYETLSNLKQHEREDIIMSNLSFVFSTSDLVKFARFVPDETVQSEVSQKLDLLVEVYKKREALLAVEQQRKEVVQ